MSEVLVIAQPRKIDFDNVEDRPLKGTEVRVCTLYSGISAGTELTAYRGNNPYLSKQWDAINRLFHPSEAPSQPYPLSGWGYEEVGEVIEVGTDVTTLKAGDIVYGTWGHRTHPDGFGKICTMGPFRSNISAVQGNEPMSPCHWVDGNLNCRKGVTQ